MASRCSICEIDPDSGFCHGVVRAVNKAEEFLSGGGRLYSLGAMVHNTAEIARLAGKGLQTIDLEDINSLGSGDTLLIRAHGEPPATYDLARARSINIIDCTCPVVLKLQKDIAAAWRTVSVSGGSVVIFGKRGHAEVNGLVGQTGGKAIVIENLSEVEQLDFKHHIELFSQTTSNPEAYQAIKAACRERTADIAIHDTICTQVRNRHSHLAAFACGHDVILFVSGRESSNGKVLFDLCRKNNPRTYWVENPQDLEDIICRLSPETDESAKETDTAETSPLRIGITGATSTPRWQLEAVAESVKAI